MCNLRNISSSKKEESCSRRTTSKTTTGTNAVYMEHCAPPSPQGSTKILGYNLQTSWYDRRSQRRGIGIHTLMHLSDAHRLLSVPEKERPHVYDFRPVEDQNVGTQLKNQRFLLNETCAVTSWHDCFWEKCACLGVSLHPRTITTVLVRRRERHQHWWEWREVWDLRGEICEKNIDLEDPTPFNESIVFALHSKRSRS